MQINLQHISYQTLNQFKHSTTHNTPYLSTMMSDDYAVLGDMIHERDNHIAALTNQLHQTSDSIHTLTKELHQKSSARKQQRDEHSQSIKKLKEEHLEQRQKLAKFEQNVKGGGGLRVHEYAALMRSANSSQVESSYVIRLQAQLCRAMHSLGVMESQLALVKENCSSLIKFMKEDLSHMVDDRTRREIELMNGLAQVDHEHRVMQDEMEKKINEKEELLESVREEYEELGLVYDEDEVKAALEVKYLLEQMDKIQKEKERVEKELLQALLDREKQINALKIETKELGVKLEELQSSEASEEEVVTNEKDSDTADVQKVGDGGEQIGKDNENEVNDEDQDAPVEESNKIQRETHDQNDAVETVTSQLKEATIEEDAASKQEETDDDKQRKVDDVVAGGVDDSMQTDDVVGSNPAAADDGGNTSHEDENDDTNSSSENNNEGGSGGEGECVEKLDESQSEKPDAEEVDKEERTEESLSEPLQSGVADEAETEPTSTDETTSKAKSDDVDEEDTA